MVQDFNNSFWKHSKKKAELINNDLPVIEMEFNRKATIVKISKRKLEITREGFWCPRIIISEKKSIVAQQKQIGIWGTKSEFIIDEINYSAKTRQGILFNISYSNSNGEVLSYKLNALKNKPVVEFEIKSFELPEEHLLILLALGFYSIKSVAQEALSNDFIVAAVA